MPEMLDRSARIIEGTERLEIRGLLNIGAGDVAEVAENVALVESFSNVVAFATGGGLTVFDVSHGSSHANTLTALRRWSAAPVRTAVYTHGHVDHVTGADVFDAEAERTGAPAIRYIGHESVPSWLRSLQTHEWLQRCHQPAAVPIARAVVPEQIPLPRRGVRHVRARSKPATPCSSCTTAWRDRRPHMGLGSCAPRPCAVGDLFIWAVPERRRPPEGPALPRGTGRWRCRRWPPSMPELLLPAHGPERSRHTARAPGAHRHGRGALESLHARARPDERRRHASTTSCARVRLPDRLAAPPVPATHVRRARVRGPQPVAVVRRLV